MKVAIYCRVSKEEEGLQDPENQLGPLKDYCTNREFEIRDVYIDRCSGGNSNRPEFQKMLSNVRQCYYKAIIVWSLDRFSREGISNTLGYIKQIKSYNCGLISYQEPWLDTRTEGIGEVLISIMSWVAAEEKKRISERTKAGLDKLKKRGVHLGRPFGWRKNKPPIENTPISL